MNTKFLNITLWIAQAIIAAILLMAGFTKLFTPVEELSKTLAWTASLPEVAIRLLTLVEIAGAIGILLPGILKIKPKLVATAATGIILLMVSAIVMHLSRGEGSLIGINIVITLLAAFVYWGRTKKVVITSKNK